MWDLPRPGLEPVSPALAGRFSTTAPPGKPSPKLLNTLDLTLIYAFRDRNIFQTSSRHKIMVYKRLIQQGENAVMPGLITKLTEYIFYYILHKLII